MNRNLILTENPIPTEYLNLNLNLYSNLNEKEFNLDVKCWNSNSMGVRGYVKGELELTPMGPFNIEQGGVNSRPDSHGVLE